MQALGRNTPLIRFLILALYIFFAWLYCMLPHILFSSLFPYLSPPLLIFSFENRPAPFQGGCHKRRLNLALVFLCFFLCCGISLLIGECVLLLCWV